MTVTGAWGVLNDGQLVVAGLALMLALEQATVWRWEGQRSPARPVVATALVAAGALAANHATFRLAGSPHFEAAMFVRTLTLGALVVCTLVLGATLSQQPPRRGLVLGIVAIVLLRISLWPTTDLVYAHRLVDGEPVYGPLTMPTGLLLIVLLFGYLLVTAARGRDSLERTVLTLGVFGSLVLAVTSFVTGDPGVSELLTGYLSLPSLAALSFLVWTRQNHAQLRVLELADRERSLAALSQLALRAPVTTVLEAGARVTRRHTTPPCDPQDQQFLDAVTGVLTAAAERDRATKELLHRATHDDLTGLPNRSAVQSQVARALTRDGLATRVSVALCDLDRFKAVNDVHGHQAGDDVLTVVAKRLAGIVLPCDQLGRFGGDEFAIVCTDSGGGDSVANLAARIQGAFVQPVRTRHVQARITASVGVATTDCDQVTFEADSLLRDAGTALHDAKGRGCGTVGVFSDTMRSVLVHRADIERRMAIALGRQEIVVHYQPVLDISTRKIVGFEALARWQQELALVAPAEWIPVVETTDLIHAVGEQVLTQASAQLHRWWTAGRRPQLSVNVSARQLAGPQFVDTMRRSVPAGLPPSAITLEVTESTAVDDHAIALLTTLRDAGSRIALDDFGTGYSALSAVARLPIDVIKIDQSITRRVANPDGQALVSATLAIAAALGLDVVAEGVETEDQHLRLLELGCPRGQGYLYSRPVDAAAATRMLEDGLPASGQAAARHG